VVVLVFPYQEVSTRNSSTESTTPAARKASKSDFLSVLNKLVLPRLGCEAIGLYSGFGIGRWKIAQKRIFDKEALPLMVLSQPRSSFVSQ
jgi:hypothetical protein